MAQELGVFKCLLIFLFLVGVVVGPSVVLRGNIESQDNRENTRTKKIELRARRDTINNIANNLDYSDTKCVALNNSSACNTNVITNLSVGEIAGIASGSAGTVIMFITCSLVCCCCKR